MIALNNDSFWNQFFCYGISHLNQGKDCFLMNRKPNISKPKIKNIKFHTIIVSYITTYSCNLQLGEFFPS